MSTSIGSLAVTLALDAAAFTAGLDKGDKGLKKFAAGVAKTMAAVSAASAGAGAIADAVMAPLNWIKGGIDSVADVGREAERLGVSTEKLSALQFAAGRDADAWEGALRHLNRELGAASMGSEEAAAKFRAFGLDGKELAAMGRGGAATNRASAGGPDFGCTAMPSATAPTRAAATSRSGTTRDRGPRRRAG